MNPQRHGHVPQQRHVHLAREAADGAMDLRMKLAAELRDFAPQQIQVALRRQRVSRTCDLDLDGAHDRTRLRRCDASLLKNFERFHLHRHWMVTRAKSTLSSASPTSMRPIRAAAEWANSREQRI